MSAAAQRRADRCFAVARSTTHDGERENAIALGIRIVEAAGLSLNLFDIPGRIKSVEPQRMHVDARVEDAQADLAEALRRHATTGDIFADYAAAAFARAGIRAGETIAEAQRRIFGHAVSEAKQRDADRAAKERHQAFEETRRRGYERTAEQAHQREVNRAQAAFEQARADEIRKAREIYP